MSMALIHEVRELRERLDAMLGDGPALRAEVEARIAGIEKKLDDALARVFTLQEREMDDERPPITVPKFPRCLRDIGLEPPAGIEADATFADEVEA